MPSASRNPMSRNSSATCSRVSARPDAGIFLRAPVDEVVAAFGAGPRVVGNLVGRQAPARADRLCRVIERAGGVVVGDDELSGRMQRGKWRVLLDGELIERK